MLASLLFCVCCCCCLAMAMAQCAFCLGWGIGRLGCAVEGCCCAISEANGRGLSGGRAELLRILLTL